MLADFRQFTTSNTRLVLSYAVQSGANSGANSGAFFSGRKGGSGYLDAWKGKGRQGVAVLRTYRRACHVRLRQAVPLHRHKRLIALCKYSCRAARKCDAGNVVANNASSARLVRPAERLRPTLRNRTNGWPTRRSWKGTNPRSFRAICKKKLGRQIWFGA